MRYLGKGYKRFDLKSVNRLRTLDRKSRRKEAEVVQFSFAAYLVIHSLRYRMLLSCRRGSCPSWDLGSCGVPCLKRTRFTETGSPPWRY